ncbi:hypothetical protein BDW60DRAFT_27574 [Aspergillus nidulans var. acristatus]|jgi:hypothetical protein
MKLGKQYKRQKTGASRFMLHRRGFSRMRNREEKKRRTARVKQDALKIAVACYAAATQLPTQATIQMRFTK